MVADSASSLSQAGNYGLAFKGKKEFLDNLSARRFLNGRPFRNCLICCDGDVCHLNVLPGADRTQEDSGLEDTSCVYNASGVCLYGEQPWHT